MMLKQYRSADSSLYPPRRPRTSSPVRHAPHPRPHSVIANHSPAHLNFRKLPQHRRPQQPSKMLFLGFNDHRQYPFPFAFILVCSSDAPGPGHDVPLALSLVSALFPPPSIRTATMFTNSRRSARGPAVVPPRTLPRRECTPSTSVSPFALANILVASIWCIPCGNRSVRARVGIAPDSAGCVHVSSPLLLHYNVHHGLFPGSREAPLTPATPR